MYLLLFDDEEFFNNPSFQLCCSFYNYFKLTLLKCKDSETQAFWNKINSLKRDDLEQFNQLTQNNTFISDATDFEAYYIVKLFEIISVSVLVKVNEEKPPIVVIFTKPQCLNYLSEQTKENFLLNQVSILCSAAIISVAIVSYHMFAGVREVVNQLKSFVNAKVW